MNRVVATLLVVLAALVAASPAGAFPGRNGVVAFGWTSLIEPELEPTVMSFRAIRVVDPPHTKARTVRGCRETEVGPISGDCTLLQYADPAFSPNGRLIAFDGGMSLVLRDAGRPNDVRLLRAHGVDDGEPAFSPGGRRLAFSTGDDVSQQDAAREVWVSDLRGKSARRLARDGSGPAWSTRNWIAFVRDGQVWRVRPDGRGLRQLTTRGGTSPAWSPGGTKLAFSRRGKLWTMRADGSEQRRVPGASAEDVAWSPNGRFFVVHVLSSGVWTLRTDGSRMRQLVPGGVNATSNFDANGVDWQSVPLR